MHNMSTTIKVIYIHCFKFSCKLTTRHQQILLQLIALTYNTVFCLNVENTNLFTTVDFRILWYLKFSPSFPPQRVCIKRLFRVVISPLSCSLSFGIFQGTEAENKGEEDGRLPSQFWCLVKRKESDCAARFLLTDRRRADAD